LNQASVQAVVATTGRVLSVAGNAETTVCPFRPEPFQALGVTTTGTLERYKLTDQDLAIICSSQGTIEQVRQVFNILWRADIDPSALSVQFQKASAVRCIQLLW